MRGASRLLEGAVWSPRSARSYDRGIETVGRACYFRDLTALGGQEDWVEPKGLSAPASSDMIRYPTNTESEGEEGVLTNTPTRGNHVTGTANVCHFTIEEVTP